MSFESLSERLAALQESNAQLREFIHRLANLKFQPGSIPLDDKEDNVMAELCEEIRQTLEDQNEDFELLQEDVKALPTGSPEKQIAQQNELQKKGLDDSVKRAIQELLSCRRAYHKASLQAKENLNAAQIEERKLIARSLTNPQAYDKSSPMPILQRRRTQNISEMTKDEKEVNASSDVTLALRRTHDMMAAELGRSQFAHEALKESTAALAQLGETYSTLDTMLSASKNLIGTLLRSQKSDTWYLETAFWILVTTICWLIFRRWLYGPAWWFIWFPVRLFFRSLIGVMTGIGLIGGAAVSSVDSSVSPGVTASFGSGTREVPRATMSGEDAPVVSGSSDPPQSSQEESMIDEVGRIIDEGGKQEEEEEEQADIQRNPKKRMWEEDIQVGKDEPKPKDEL